MSYSSQVADLKVVCSRRCDILFNQAPDGFRAAYNRPQPQSVLGRRISMDVVAQGFADSTEYPRTNLECSLMTTGDTVAAS